MYQKFIITQNGVLRFGTVYLHRDLLQENESCDYGGGLWKVDEERKIVLLFGRSFDFGQPLFEFVRRIEWDGLGGQAFPLFYAPGWPNESRLEPVYASGY